MYVLIVFSLLQANSVPIVENLKQYNDLNTCQKKIAHIYLNKKKLAANYPITVELKTDRNNVKFIVLKNKPDYTKPDQLSFYICKKIEEFE